MFQYIVFLFMFQSTMGCVMMWYVNEYTYERERERESIERKKEEIIMK